MALSLHQQIFDAFARSKNILIVFRTHWSVDTVAATLALARMLKRMDKPATVASSGFQAPEHLAFLPGIDQVKPALEAMRKFIVTLALRQTQVEEFTYDIIGDKLEISITPRRGFFTPQDVTTGSSQWRYDLVVMAGTPDFESLGSIFLENAEFFYHTPTINIDHTSHNEHHGKINLVDITCVATTEVVARLISMFDTKLMDESIATCLLTGIIAETESFLLPTVTPQTLTLASELMSQGAKRELIVEHLYRTKTLPSLKLWGRVLARLKADHLVHLVWSVIPKTDFEKVGATPDELAGVMDELMVAVPHTRLALLIIEEPAGQAVALQARAVDRHLDLRALFAVYRPQGERFSITATIPAKPLLAVEREVVDEIRAKLLNIK